MISNKEQKSSACDANGRKHPCVNTVTSLATDNSSQQKDSGNPHLSPGGEVLLSHVDVKVHPVELKPWLAPVEVTRLEQDITLNMIPTGKHPCPPVIVEVRGFPVQSEKQVTQSRSLTDDERSHILSTLKLVLNTYEKFGFRSEGYSMKSNNEIWLSECALAGDWMKYAKWRLAVFAAVHFEQKETPAPPVDGLRSGSYLLGGRAVRFVRCLRDNTERFAEFLTTLNAGVKRGCDRPDEKAVAKGCAKTFKALTTVRPRQLLCRPEVFPQGTSEHLRGTMVNASALRLFISDREIDQDELTAQLVRTVDELFPPSVEAGVDYVDALARPIVPSTSAVYNNSRSRLGGFGDISDRLERNDLPLSIAKRYVDLTTRQNKYVWWYIDEPSFEQDLECVLDSEERWDLSYVLDDSNLRHEQLRTISKLVADYQRAPDNRAEIVGLSEALKVRCITKGNSILNYVLKPLQKVMHTTLRRHPVFRLIGRPVEVSDIESIMKHPFLKAVHMPKMFISGDYSAATDELRRWASEAVALRIANNLKIGNVMTDLFLTNLCRNRLVLTEKVGGGKQVVGEAEQVEGQLMGSITSFPILCLINAALIRYCYELRCSGGRARYKLHQLPLLVNGDDCLFVGDQNLKDVWSLTCSSAGLVESMGKTFIHPTMANINSTCFLAGKSGVKQIGFVNYGLLMGLKRSAQSSSNCEEDDIFSLAQSGRDLVNQAPQFLRNSLAREFFYRHEHRVRDYGVSYFMPTWAGGLGLPTFEHQGRQCTDLAEIARQCLRLKFSHHLGDLEEVGALKSVTTAEWKTRILGYDKLKEMKLEMTTDEDIDDSGEGSVMYWAFRAYLHDCYEGGEREAIVERLKMRVKQCKKLFEISLKRNSVDYNGFVSKVAVDEFTSQRLIDYDMATKDPRVRRRYALALL